MIKYICVLIYFSINSYLSNNLLSLWFRIIIPLDLFSFISKPQLLFYFNNLFKFY